MKFFLCEITGRNRRCVIRRIFFLRKNKKVTDNHTILDVSGIFCRKMVSLGKKRPSAQVAIQEAARIACQKPEEMMSSPNPAGWLRKTAGLVAKNMLREQARQKRTFLPLEVLLPESEPSEWDDSDRELVQLCLDVVSEEDFTLFRRVTLDGWTYVDAAKAAGISLWACYKRVERTQKKLRRAIEEHPERFF